MAVPAWAADGLPVPYEGRLITGVIDEFRADGYPFAYSTILVSSDLVVQAEPSAGSPLEIVRQILQPHGLKIRSDSGVHLIVRDTSSTQSSADDSTQVTAASAVPGPIETVIVSASYIQQPRRLQT